MKRRCIVVIVVMVARLPLILHAQAATARGKVLRLLVYKAHQRLRANQVSVAVVKLEVQPSVRQLNTTTLISMHRLPVERMYTCNSYSLFS